MPLDGVTQSLSAVEILRRGRERLSNPSNWWQYGFTLPRKKADGGKALCTMATLNHVVGISLWDEHGLARLRAASTLEARQYLERATGADNVAFGLCKWNCLSSYQEVLAGWDKAIELAEQDEREKADAL